MNIICGFLHRKRTTYLLLEKQDYSGEKNSYRKTTQIAVLIYVVIEEKLCSGCI